MYSGISKEVLLTNVNTGTDHKQEILCHIYMQKQVPLGTVEK